MGSEVIALLLWSGAAASLTSWQISLGTLTAFVFLFRRFFDPITALGEEWQTVQSALSGAERIFQVLDIPSDEAGEETLKQDSEATGIEVRQITFGYFQNQPVLKQVSFSVRSGEHVALVGRTGAGKTSIVHLLGGLYAPWEGKLRLNGIDPRQISEHERQRLIGVVPQVVQLFSGTVLDNLTLEDDSVRLDADRNAARTSGADHVHPLPAAGIRNSDQQRIGGGDAALFRSAAAAIAGTLP